MFWKRISGNRDEEDRNVVRWRVKLNNAILNR